MVVIVVGRFKLFTFFRGAIPLHYSYQENKTCKSNSSSVLKSKSLIFSNASYRNI
jgi:hypothetical protein